MNKRKRLNFRQVASFVTVFALVFSLAGCAGTAGTGTSAAASTAGTASTAATKEKIVNIGVTDSLGTLNPLLQDGGELNKYATAFLFLPLVDLDNNLKFAGQLAESITTTDNITFTVKIEKNATWSDGKPITADDVIFTVLRLTSKEVGNTTMAGYAQIVGFSDEGFSPEGGKSAAGLVKVDDKTVQFVSKQKMSLATFENSFARYILTLPKHVLESVPLTGLATDKFFNNPTVVSGPFKLVSFDKDHFISYVANKSYFKGAPIIDKLNIKIVQGSQLYAGLQSGEIDFVQQTTGVIPQEDYASVQALDKVKPTLEKPLTNQLMFINNRIISDVRVRQAISYAINRKQIVADLLKGNGEVAEGFLTSLSPYFDSSITPNEYNPEKAKALVKAAGWDSSKELNFLVNAGDSTFVQAASIIAANLAEVGIKVKITTVDFATLMNDVTAEKFDIYAVQYTIAPVDPYPDVQWLISGKNHIGYANTEVDKLLSKTQTTNDNAEIKSIYSSIDTTVQKDVPLYSVYVIRALGAASKRLVNAEPHTYGSFLNINKWDVTQ